MSVSTSPTARSVWRSLRAPALVGLLILVFAIIVALVGGGGGKPGRYLDPDDTSFVGAKGLAQVLRARGVKVDRVDSVSRAEALGAEGNRLLLVTSTAMYGSADVARLARIPGDRLIVGDQPSLGVLAPGVSAKSAPARATSMDPECELPAARLAGSVFMGGAVFNVPGTSVTCYPVKDGPTLVSYQANSATITVVGSGAFMTNQRLDEDGNAALAMNLAGSASAVTWLVDPPEDTTGEPGEDLAGPEGKSLAELMPASVGWGVLMAVIAVLVTGFWRGRRLGPVVVEKLPVVVRAAETVEGRGRLYRARRARGRAADALRAGTLDRIVPRLGLAAGVGREAIVSAIAVRTGHEAQRIGAALYGQPPPDDAALVALAGYLDFLERTVVAQ